MRCQALFGRKAYLVLESLFIEMLYPGRVGSEIATRFDAHRVLEVLVQMIDVLDHSILHAAAHRDVVEERQMLHVLAETDAAGMRTNRDSELRRHEQHRDDLVHSAETAAVDLTVADGLAPAGAA